MSQLTCGLLRHIAEDPRAIIRTPIHRVDGDGKAQCIHDVNDVVRTDKTGADTAQRYGILDEQDPSRLRPGVACENLHLSARRKALRQEGGMLVPEIRTGVAQNVAPGVIQQDYRRIINHLEASLTD